ncbi:hypothetical protein B0H13DRAFT_2357728 [Mycena leptocephala]|nr:hypothetical protein B0H13DRAFT_2357728 [Mycena leptocephala]
MPAVHGKTIVSSDDNLGLSDTPTKPSDSTTPAPGQSELEESTIGPRYSPGQIGILWAGFPSLSGSSPPGTPVPRQRAFYETLPDSSPILSSSEGSPVAGPSQPLALPDLSSDGLIYTSPIVGTKAERKAKAYQKGMKKRQAALTLVAEKAPTREEIFDGILQELVDNKLSFGDLMLYVFDPIYKQGQTRWNGLFRRPGLATKILELWVSRENSETAREEVDVWASDYIAEQAKEITAAKALQTGGNVDADYVDGFSMWTMYDFLQLHAKTAMKVFEAFATSARNARSNLPHALRNKPRALALLGEYSHKNIFSRRIMAIYLYASGAQRQTISVLAHLGISESYQNLIQKPHFLVNRHARETKPGEPLPATPPSTPITSDPPYIPPDPMALGSCWCPSNFRMGTLRQLSGSMRDMARSVAATGLYAAHMTILTWSFVPPNRSWEKQTLRKWDLRDIWPLWKARLEEMNIKDLMRHGTYGQALQHCILRIIVDHGGDKFQKFCEALDNALPVTPDKIELHKTPLHPLTAWNIDQSTIVRNEEVVDAIHDELRVKGLSHWNWVVKFFAGDQLTIA